MKTHFKISASLLKEAMDDFKRAHPFAGERVGFFVCRFGMSGSRELLILAHRYLSAADEHYLESTECGALLGPEGFHVPFNFAFVNAVGVFHVHLHDHIGTPRFSLVDKREMSRYVPDFFNARPRVPHGAVVLSRNSISGKVWTDRRSKGQSIDRFTLVGTPVKRLKGGTE